MLSGSSIFWLKEATTTVDTMDDSILGYCDDILPDIPRDITPISETDEPEELPDDPPHNNTSGISRFDYTQYSDDAHLGEADVITSAIGLANTADTSTNYRERSASNPHDDKVQPNPSSWWRSRSKSATTITITPTVTTNDKPPLATRRKWSFWDSLLEPGGNIYNKYQTTQDVDKKLADERIQTLKEQQIRRESEQIRRENEPKDTTNWSQEAALVAGFSHIIDDDETNSDPALGVKIRTPHRRYSWERGRSKQQRMDKRRQDLLSQDFSNNEALMEEWMHLTQCRAKILEDTGIEDGFTFDPLEELTSWDYNASGWRAGSVFSELVFNGLSSKKSPNSPKRSIAPPRLPANAIPESETTKEASLHTQGVSNDATKQRPQELEADFEARLLMLDKNFVRAPTLNNKKRTIIDEPELPLFAALVLWIPPKLSVRKPPTEIKDNTFVWAKADAWIHDTRRVLRVMNYEARMQAPRDVTPAQLPSTKSNNIPKPHTNVATSKPTNDATNKLMLTQGVHGKDKYDWQFEPDRTLKIVQRRKELITYIEADTDDADILAEWTMLVQFRSFLSQMGTVFEDEAVDL
eukprot:m.226925 g.226925  ORF g.226925 m.226925 type:complete len:581 (+) comp33507_c0_seq3:379-2121(+)